MAVDGRNRNLSGIEQIGRIGFHGDARLRRRINRNPEVASHERSIVGMIEVPMTEEDRLGTQADQVLHHEGSASGHGFAAMHIRIEQDDATLDRCRVRRIGDPGEDDFLVVDFASGRIDVFDSEKELSRSHQIDGSCRCRGTAIR